MCANGVGGASLELERDTPLPKSATLEKVVGNGAFALVLFTYQKTQGVPRGSLTDHAAPRDGDGRGADRPVVALAGGGGGGANPVLARRGGRGERRRPERHARHAEGSHLMMLLLLFPVSHTHEKWGGWRALSLNDRLLFLRWD